MKTPTIFDTPLAGYWHAAKRDNLIQEIDSLLPKSPPEPAGKVSAIVAPHAGYTYSGATSADVYLRLNPSDYDRIIIIGPSHYAHLPNRAAVLLAEGYRTPIGTSSADTELIKRLLKIPQVISDPHPHTREHSHQIQLPLAQRLLGLDKKIVCMVLGSFDSPDREAFANALRPLLDRRTLLVISTDFTHYGPNFGYTPFGPAKGKELEAKIEALDNRVFDCFSSWNIAALDRVFDETRATVCGREALALLMELHARKPEVVKTGYTTSARVSGDYANSVSYLGALVYGAWGEQHRASDDELGAEDRATLLKLARESIRDAVNHQRSNPPPQPPPEDDAPALHERRAVFVTLTMQGLLRGCIGEIEPRSELWRAVAERAADAAMRDPRFPPVRPDELDHLRIEISVLTPPRSIGSYTEIEVGRHGVILRKAAAGAVFLPQVAKEQGWDRATMLTQLSLKAGLPPDSWRQGAEFLVFETLVFSE